MKCFCGLGFDGARMRLGFCRFTLCDKEIQSRLFMEELNSGNCIILANEVELLRNPFMFPVGINHAWMDDTLFWT